MVKITFIGAGSLVFGLKVLTDILTFPQLRKNTTICLEDIEKNRLDFMYKYFVKYKNDNLQDLEGITIEKTTNQRKAIEDAKYIISAIQIGGFEAYNLDLEIPLKFGVTQSVGDTLGPAGVFRFLRVASALRSIVNDIRDYGYNSGNYLDKPIFMNYVNPMAMNVWYLNKLVPDSTIGLCHGVKETASKIARWLDIELQNLRYFCAGINHMAWFLKLRYKDPKNLDSQWEDAYPKIKQIFSENPNRFKKHQGVRWDMMKASGGYFMTETDGHLSEYLPYYRKRKDLLSKYSTDGDYFTSLEHAENYYGTKKMADELPKRFAKYLELDKLKLKLKPSHEFAPHIINAIETGNSFVFNGNVLNKDGGLITNLPDGCCVEVPMWADGMGLHPQGGIKLPTVCQALNISNIMVQKAAVEGMLENDKEKIYQAILLDPNTASVLSPEEIRDMVDEMFKAQTKWVPKLN